MVRGEPTEFSKMGSLDVAPKSAIYQKREERGSIRGVKPSKQVQQAPGRSLTPVVMGKRAKTGNR